MVCGYYVDASGLAHGFVGKVETSGASQANTRRPMVPVKPVPQLPDIPGMVAPAL